MSYTHLLYHIVYGTKNRLPLISETWESAFYKQMGGIVRKHHGIAIEINGMPDHVHLFCGPRDLRFTVEKWVEFWKRQFSREHRNSEWVWQRSCFHRRLRSGEDYAEKLRYVRENPVRKGLVRDAAEWRFGGRVEELRW